MRPRAAALQQGPQREYAASLFESLPMTDDEFLARFTDCTLPEEHFTHLGHLRLACLQLQRAPFDAAVQNTCAGIRRYATHLGATDKFHWTITQALMHLLQAAGAAERGR